MNAQLNKVKKNSDPLASQQHEKDIDEAIRMVWEHKKSLINDLDKLSKADGHPEWREKEAKDLSDLVQRRFRYSTHTILFTV